RYAFMVLGTLSPFIEEIYYRGFMFGTLEESLRALLRFSAETLGDFFPSLAGLPNRARYASFEARAVPFATGTFVGLWFTAIHGPQYWPNAGAILSIGLIAATTSILRAKTGSILPGILAHGFYNWPQIALALLAGTTP